MGGAAKLGVVIAMMVGFMGLLMLPDAANYLIDRTTFHEKLRDKGPLRWFIRRYIQFMVISLIVVTALDSLKHHWPLNDAEYSLLGLALYVALLMFLGWIRSGYRGFMDGSPTSTLRGTVIAEPKEHKHLSTALKKAKSSLNFASLPVHPEAETRHFKLIGTTGTGKSTVIRTLVHGALQRGDRAIVADPDGSALSYFYRPERGDVILNPFDARSHTWSLIDEIYSAHDVRLIAESLIPNAKDDEWRHYARLFITALLTHCKQKKETLKAFWYLAVAAPQSELKAILAGTPAAPYLEPDNARMFGSIRSVASTHLAPLEYIKTQGQPFSIRGWIRNGKGSLFLPYRSDQIAALRELISTWMRLAILETLRLEEKDNHLWFCVDELDALGRIDGMKDALARIRKYGGRMVLGFQSISQVRATYGDEADTIVENCANTLILKCSASEGGGTSKFASDLIGEQERSFMTMSLDMHRNISKQQQIVTDQAVLASEIEQLADRSGYVKLADQKKWFRVESIEGVELVRGAQAFEEVGI